MAGKVEAGLREDDPRNPAVVADNVGDNVGDIAGMGADLFGSFAESSCAAMVISAQSPSPEIFGSWSAMCFPLVLIGSGIFASFATTFVATHLVKVRSAVDVEASLKRQLVVSTVIMTVFTFILCMALFPSTPFDISTKTHVRNWHIYMCVMCGLWSGLLIGFITEYYTSHSYTPVREVANACKTGGQSQAQLRSRLSNKQVQSRSSV